MKKIDTEKTLINDREKYQKIKERRVKTYIKGFDDDLDFNLRMSHAGRINLIDKLASGQIPKEFREMAHMEIEQSRIDDLQTLLKYISPK